MSYGRRLHVSIENGKRTALAAALGLSLGLPGHAQQATDSSASQQFDPTPFLTAMVEYRMLAFSCEEVLPGSPLNDSAAIAQYFEDLGQPAPVGTDEQMDRLVYVLIRSQAASICSERLLESALAYGEQAVIYQSSKPESWPTAPSISAGPWCEDEACSNLR